MKRAYLHGILDLNAGKLNALNALFAPFRDALKKTMAYWHVRLQQGADLPLYVALPDKTSVGGLVGAADEKRGQHGTHPAPIMAGVAGTASTPSRHGFVPDG